MKNVAFIITHFGSGANSLCDSLNVNPRIQILKTPQIYNSINSVEILTSLPHKLKNSAAIYMDVLTYNFQISWSNLLKIGRFIYLIREARPSLNKIMEEQKKSSLQAQAYYRYRLRRICEIAKQTPGAVLLTWEDLASKRGLKTIEEYLNLKEPLHLEINEKIEDIVDVKVASTAQECYERYLKYMKKLNLRRP